MPNINPTPSLEDGVTRVVVDPTRVQHASVPAVGPSGDGADARTPEATKPTGACNYVEMPDNTGPTTHGGTTLGENYGR